MKAKLDLLKEKLFLEKDMITEINYKPNLSIIDNNVYSYKTKVAKIEGNKLICLDWNVNGMTTSPTTTRHINCVAKEFNLNLTPSNTDEV